MQLIVYSDAVNPAHWSIYIIPPGRQSGTLIHVVSSYYGGFMHEVKPYDEGNSRSRREKFFLGEFDERYISNVVSTAQGIDANREGCGLTPDIVSRTLFHLWPFLF
jgi:hypothetical protein